MTIVYIRLCFKCYDVCPVQRVKFKFMSHPYLFLLTDYPVLISILYFCTKGEKNLSAFPSTCQFY